MKTKVLIMLSLALFFLANCSEKDEITDPQPTQTLSHSKTEYLGCFIDPPTRDTLLPKDSIFYEVQNDTLVLNITMVETCVATFIDSVVMQNDSVNIYIRNTNEDVAYCKCEFDFKYHFTNYGDNVFFTVYTSSVSEPEYVLWNTLSYP